MLEVIICLRENSHIWNKMDVVLYYRTAREDKITRTKEKVSEYEDVYRVVEAQKYGIECQDKGGTLANN